MWQTRSLRRANIDEDSPGCVKVSRRRGKGLNTVLTHLRGLPLGLFPAGGSAFIENKGKKYSQPSDLLGTVTKPLNTAKGTFVQRSHLTSSRKCKSWG